MLITGSTWSTWQPWLTRTVWRESKADLSFCACSYHPFYFSSHHARAHKVPEVSLAILAPLDQKVAQVYQEREVHQGQRERKEDKASLARQE